MTKIRLFFFYSFFERNKEKLLLDNAKRLVYNKVEEITITSDNSEEAVEKMKKLVDKYANQFVVKDDVMDGVPVETLNNLKRELEPVILKHCQIQKRRKQAMKVNAITFFLFVFVFVDIL